MAGIGNVSPGHLQNFPARRITEIDGRVLILRSNAANQLIEAVSLRQDGFDDDAPAFLADIHHFVQTSGGRSENQGSR